MCHGGRLLADFTAGTTDRPEVPEVVAATLTTTADGVWVVWARKYAHVAGGRFTALTGGTSYPADAVAVCRAGKDHEAPQPDCTCGFHAITGTMRIGSPFGDVRALDVALTGRVLAFEWTGPGVLFRAARQTVARVQRDDDPAWRRPPTEPGGRLARLVAEVPRGSGPVRLAVEDDAGFCSVSARGRRLGMEAAVHVDHLARRRPEPVG